MDILINLFNKHNHDSSDDPPKNKGEVIYDATVCPQDIAYPTDLGLLNKAREITEEIIDKLHQKEPLGKKARTYREIARKKYLKIAQNKNPSKRAIRGGIKAQLQFLKRNFKTIEKQLDTHQIFPLGHKLQRKYWIIQTLYAQQQDMFKNNSHQVDDRIVSIHEPHVRPIVRGKARSKTEFGAKIHLSLVNGYSLLDTVSWNAFNEGSSLIEYVENYKKRIGCYPSKVMADKIYCTRENRKWLQEKNIKLAAKPLGRPSAQAVEKHVSPGERNPIEGKFGQAKNGYGMNRIKARLKETSQSWISSIILVLNLVKLAGEALLCLSFSAWVSLICNLMENVNTICHSIKIKNQSNFNAGLVLRI
jgi:transposase, IS5 family